MERLEFHRQTDRAMSSFYSRSWFGTLPFRSLALAIRTGSIAQVNTHVNIDGGALGNKWTDERCGMDPNEAKQRVQDVLKVLSVGVPVFAWWKHRVDKLEGKPKRTRVRFQKEYPGSDFGKPGWEFLPRPCWTCGGLGLSKQQCVFCAGMGHMSVPRLLNPIANELLGRKKRHFICKCFICRGYGLRSCPDCDALYTKGGLLRPLARPDDNQLDEWGMLKRPSWESIPLPERRRRAAPVQPGWKEEEDPTLKILESESNMNPLDSPNSPIKEFETLVPSKRK